MDQSPYLAVCQVSAGHCLAFVSSHPSHCRSTGPISHESQSRLLLCRARNTNTHVHAAPFCVRNSRVVKHQLRKHRPAVALTTSHILFGFDSVSGVPVVFTTLLGILRHHVGWLITSTGLSRSRRMPNLLLRAPRPPFAFLCACTNDIAPWRCLSATGWLTGSSVPSPNRDVYGLLEL